MSTARISNANPLGRGGGVSVLDEMPKDRTTEQVTGAFTSVGFSSVPSWCKPYAVLSEGEKMRVDLAKAILSDDSTILFDEFTSVVDRHVAEVACIAMHKAIVRSDKRFIGVSCHYDVEPYLEPDWVFDTATMAMRTGADIKKRDTKNSSSAVAINRSGPDSHVITI